MVEIALEMSSVGLTSLGIAHLSYTKNVHEEQVWTLRQTWAMNIFKEIKESDRRRILIENDILEEKKKKRKNIENNLLNEFPELTLKERIRLSYNMMWVEEYW